MNYVIGEVISNHRKNKKISQIELAEIDDFMDYTIIAVDFDGTLCYSN